MARIKPQAFRYEGLFPKRALAMHVPCLDPQPYLPLEINDFEMLSPEPGDHISCGFLLPILHVRRQKIAA